MSSAGVPGVRRSSTTRDSAGAVSSSLSRTSQPPGSSSTSHMPSVGIQARPGASSSGSRMRLCSGSESTAATQPSASTASAGRPMRARIGAATVRNRFNVRSCCSRRWDSASRATTSTSATVVGCTVAAGPETSTTPMT